MQKRNSGIRLLTLITSIRWFGWGVGEAFLPILFLMLSNSFFGTGLLTAVYSISFLFFLPLSGYLADKIKIKYLILISMVIYIIIGLSYFLAGFLGMILFIVIARILNGASFSLDKVGRESYFIRHTSKKHMSQNFGKFDKITNFWWMLAIILGVILINYTEIHWLLLAIVPTSILSFFITLKLKENSTRKKLVGNPYSTILKKIKKLNKELKVLVVIVFFFSLMNTIIYYFAPAVTYSRGESMTNSVILILAYSIPLLFGEKLGRLADKLKFKSYLLGLISLSFVLVMLAFSPEYYLLLVSMFIAGVTFELVSLTNIGLMSRSSNYREVGEIDSVFSGVSSLGAIIGPLIFGFFLDILKPMHSYFLALFSAGIMFVFVYRNR